MPLAIEERPSMAPADPFALWAGRLSARLDPAGTALRDVAIDGEVVLRSLAFVARDPDWGTLALGGETAVTPDGTATIIESRGEGAFPNGHLAWRVRFRLAAEEVEAVCTARSETGFRTNRTGLVVLHALQACRGRDAIVTTPSGRSVPSRYPDLVSPHQPFREVGAIEHATSGGASVRITFSGEVFETEDQRNWTDASFKTYSRPLAEPFPYEIPPGEATEQRVRVALAAIRPDQRPRRQSEAPWVRVAAPLPRIGTGLPVWRPIPSAGVNEAFRGLGLSFTAYEIDPALDGWNEQLAVHLSAHPGPFRLDCRVGAATDPDAFLRELRRTVANRLPEALSLWDVGADAVRSARPQFPGVRLGGGTGAFFAELNRGSLPPDIDYAAWTSTPTVHASDDDTIGESVEPLPDIVATARHKAPGLGLAVGPLTLAMRYNPNATSAAARRAESPADQRQHTVLAAAWLLGSIAGFLDPAVESLTVFEACGPKGLIGPDGGRSPAAHLVARLASLGGALAESLLWPHETRTRGLLISPPGGARVLVLAQNRADAARLPLPPGGWRSLERLNNGGFTAAAWSGEPSVEVEGFGVAWLDEANERSRPGARPVVLQGRKA